LALPPEHIPSLAVLLNKPLRPYRFIRDQGYDMFVDEKRGYDHIPGYDEVDQLFWYPEGIAIACIVFTDRTCLVNIPPVMCFMCFNRMDWNRAFFQDALRISRLSICLSN
jgi:1,3-beta-glucan synthase